MNLCAADAPSWPELVRIVRSPRAHWGKSTDYAIPCMHLHSREQLSNVRVKAPPEEPNDLQCFDQDSSGKPAPGAQQTVQCIQHTARLRSQGFFLDVGAMSKCSASYLSSDKPTIHTQTQIHTRKLHLKWHASYVACLSWSTPCLKSDKPALIVTHS